MGMAVITAPQTTHNKMLPVRLEKSRKWPRSNQPRARGARLRGGGRGTIPSCHSSAKQSCRAIIFFFLPLSFVPNLKFDKKKITESVSIYFLRRAAVTHCVAIESVTIQMGDFFFFFCTAAKSDKRNNTPLTSVLASFKGLVCLGISGISASVF